MTGEYADTSAEGWDKYLFEGETIVWEGRPHRRFIFANRGKVDTALGAAVMGLSVLGLIVIHLTGASGSFVPILTFGFGMFPAFGIQPRQGLLRGATHYTLTNRRGLIASDLFGKRQLNGYYINPNTTLDYIPGPPGTIYFALEEKTVRRRDLVAEQQRKSTPHRGNNGPIYKDVVVKRWIGFEYIDDAPHVYDMMQRMQKGEALSPDPAYKRPTAP